MHLKWWVIISLVIAGVSLYSLNYVVTTIWPNPQRIISQPQLLFLTFTFLGLSASTVPISAFFNQRFAKEGWFDRDFVENRSAGFAEYKKLVSDGFSPAIVSKMTGLDVSVIAALAKDSVQRGHIPGPPGSRIDDANLDI